MRIDAFFDGSAKPGQPIICPFHDDTNASARVTPDQYKFYCYPCNIMGDQVEIAARLFYPNESKGAGMQLARELLASKNWTVKPPVKVVRAEDPRILDVVDHFARLCCEDLRTNVRICGALRRERGLLQPVREGGLGVASYYAFQEAAERVAEPEREQLLLQAGLVFPHFPPRTDEEARKPPKSLAQRYRLGGRLILPERRAGRTIYYQARDPNPDAELRYLNPPGLAKQLFGFDTLHRPTMRIWLVEGYFDMAPLREKGESAIAVAGLPGGTEKLQDVLHLRGDREIIIAFDSDAAGQAKAASLAGKLAGTPHRIIVPRGKDICAWALAEGIEAVLEA